MLAPYISPKCLSVCIQLYWKQQRTARPVQQAKAQGQHHGQHDGPLQGVPAEARCLIRACQHLSLAVTTDLQTANHISR